MAGRRAGRGGGAAIGLWPRPERRPAAVRTCAPGGPAAGLLIAPGARRGLPLPRAATCAPLPGAPAARALPPQ